MSNLTFSVIIPAYNGAEFIGEAIDSVLAQSYPHFEIIVVNDLSTDNTGEVVKAYTDRRIRYIEHETNQGADIARKTALHASTGDLIAFLDQDDYFHSEKLATHAAQYEEAPETGLTYNARYEFDGGTGKIREIWRPPDSVTLADLCMGFPFAPSDTVLRREWAMREEIWDQSSVLVGEEIVTNGTEIIFCGRLFLAGCVFASVPGVLNYRRYHPARVLSDLSIRRQAELLCQEAIFADPRCPEEIQNHSHLAYMNTNLIWAYYAYAQDEIEHAKEYLSEAIRLNPALLRGNPCELTEFLLFNSCTDDSRSHEVMLEKIFSNLPEECSQILPQKESAIAEGYLIRGTQAMQWGRTGQGKELLDIAFERGAKTSDAYNQKVVFQLLQLESEQGPAATATVLNNLMPHIKSLSQKNDLRHFRACYAINRAYLRYQKGDYASVPGDVLRAVVNDAGKLWDRGVLSIFFRSLLRAPFLSQA